MIRILAGVEELTAGAAHDRRPSGDRVLCAEPRPKSLDYSRTVLDELEPRSAGDDHDGDSQPARRDAVFGRRREKRVGVLSGGERARLALAKVIAHRNNCLLLDEPTNNLDIVAKETLLEALRRFPGTVIIVSHDRHILNQLVNRGDRGRSRPCDPLPRQLRRVPGEKSGGRGCGYRRRRRRGRTPPPRITPRSARNGAGSTAASPAPSAHAADDRRANARSGRNDQARDTDREAQRAKSRTARQRAEIEARIEKNESERAAIALEMNDPNFYLARKDAKEMIDSLRMAGTRNRTALCRIGGFEQPGAP